MNHEKSISVPETVSDIHLCESRAYLWKNLFRRPLKYNKSQAKKHIRCLNYHRYDTKNYKESNYEYFSSPQNRIIRYNLFITKSEKDP